MRQRTTHGQGSCFCFLFKKQFLFVPLFHAGCSSTMKILTYGGRRRRHKTVRLARDHMCLYVCVCVWASKNAFHNCLWLNATLKQLFVRPTVNDYTTTTTSAVMRLRWGRMMRGGGSATTWPGVTVKEGEEMFSVIEPVRGMSTVKFISYNIIFYVRVWFLHIHTHTHSRARASAAWDSTNTHARVDDYYLTNLL